MAALLILSMCSICIAINRKRDAVSQDLAFLLSLHCKTEQVSTGTKAGPISFALTEPCCKWQQNQDAAVRFNGQDLDRIV